jgi:hypothetical protein
MGALFAFSRKVLLKSGRGWYDTSTMKNTNRKLITLSALALAAVAGSACTTQRAQPAVAPSTGGTCAVKTYFTNPLDVPVKDVQAAAVGTTVPGTVDVFRGDGSPLAIGEASYFLATSPTVGTFNVRLSLDGFALDVPVTVAVPCVR